jgi:hypothetical protein
MRYCSQQSILGKQINDSIYLSEIWNFFSLISPRDIVSINNLTDNENYHSVWRQTHYEVTNENKNVSFEGLDIHYH